MARPNPVLGHIVRATSYRLWRFLWFRQATIAAFQAGIARNLLMHETPLLYGLRALYTRLGDTARVDAVTRLIQRVQ